MGRPRVTSPLRRTGMLQHRQALVVIHRQHGIAFGQLPRVNSVSAGSGPIRCMPSAAVHRVTGPITRSLRVPDGRLRRHAVEAADQDAAGRDGERRSGRGAVRAAPPPAPCG